MEYFAVSFFFFLFESFPVKSMLHYMYSNFISFVVTFMCAVAVFLLFLFAIYFILFSKFSFNQFGFSTLLLLFLYSFEYRIKWKDLCNVEFKWRNCNVCHNMTDIILCDAIEWCLKLLDSNTVFNFK